MSLEDSSEDLSPPIASSPPRRARSLWHVSVRTRRWQRFYLSRYARAIAVTAADTMSTAPTASRSPTRASLTSRASSTENLPPSAPTCGWCTAMPIRHSLRHQPHGIGPVYHMPRSSGAAPRCSTSAACATTTTTSSSATSVGAALARSLGKCECVLMRGMGDGGGESIPEARLPRGLHRDERQAADAGGESRRRSRSSARRKASAPPLKPADDRAAWEIGRRKRSTR